MGSCTGATLDISVPGNAEGKAGHGNASQTSMNRFYDESIVYVGDSTLPLGNPSIQQTGFGGKSAGPGSSVIGGAGLAGGIKIFEDLG
jgi:hypothetical protein